MDSRHSIRGIRGCGVTCVDMVEGFANFTGGCCDCGYEIEGEERMREPSDLSLLHSYLNKKYEGEENVHFVGVDGDIAKFQIRVGSKWTHKKFKKDGK